MKNAFVDSNGVLSAFGFMEANGKDTIVPVPDDFDGGLGKVRYDGSQWVPYVDLGAAKANNQAARDALLAVAALRIAPLQDALDLGAATDADVATLKAWKQYRVAVNRVDLASTDTMWPIPPA